MLDLALRNPDTVAAERARFEQAGRLRLQPFVEAEVAEAVLSELRARPFELVRATRGFRFLYSQHEFVPEAHCQHALCAFGRFLYSEGCAFLSELSAIPLSPPEHGRVTATLYSKGSYLDAHDDHDGKRRVGFVFGLTREPWPVGRGGALEFLEAEEERVSVVERRLPGFNTLDLIDVRGMSQTHRVTIVEDHAERFAITGWFF